jgi:hypothetical protein
MTIAVRLKVANSTNLFATILIVHDGYFEPTIRILSGRIKGQDLALVMTKYPSSSYK